MTSAPSEAAAEEWLFPNRSTPVGSAAYYAVRFSPAPMRQRNALLLAWYDLIQDMAAQPHDPGVARLKLDWWRLEIGHIVRGNPRHPLAISLQQADLNDRAEVLMSSIIDAAEAEILSPQLNTDREFAAACRDSLGNFFVLLSLVERRTDYDPDYCLGQGGYCAAVERIRRLAECPRRVPLDMDPESLANADPADRTSRIDSLLNQFETSSVPAGTQMSDLARRLTMLAEAMRAKMRKRGYPVAETLIDRAPIAQLWTAWRCR